MVDEDGKYTFTEEPDGFPSRLREALHAFGSISAAATAIGRSEGAVRKWLRGESQPNVADLRSICKVTGANVEWLVTGKGTRDGKSGIGVDADAALRRDELGPLDYHLMDDVAIAVKLEPRVNGVPVTPEKCVSILTTLYNLSRITRQVDIEAAERVASLTS